MAEALQRRAGKKVLFEKIIAPCKKKQYLAFSIVDYYERSIVKFVIFSYLFPH